MKTIKQMLIARKVRHQIKNANTFMHIPILLSNIFRQIRNNLKTCLSGAFLFGGGGGEVQLSTMLLGPVLSPQTFKRIEVN